MGGYGSLFEPNSKEIWLQALNYTQYLPGGSPNPYYLYHMLFI
jgi:hypothetical protein